MFQIHPRTQSTMSLSLRAKTQDSHRIDEEQGSSCSILKPKPFLCRFIMRHYKMIIAQLACLAFFVLFVDATGLAAAARRAQKLGLEFPFVAASLTMAGTKSANGAAAGYASSHPNSRQEAIKDGDYIRADGLRLKDSNGDTFYIQGMNYWSCMTLAAGKEAGGDLERLITELDQLSAVGVNVLRIMAAAEGAPTRQPNRIYPPLQPEPGKWDERVFKGLDVCLDEASKRGMRVIMTMGNTWQWTGGISQQVAWSQGKQDIPYPSGWDLTLPPQRTDGHPGWGNYTGAPFSPFVKYQEQFYSDPGAQEIYMTHLNKVMNRINSVNERRYTDDPTILAWEPLNEPQDNQFQPAGTPDTMVAWHHKTFDYIKRKAPKQMTTTGYEGKTGEKSFNLLHNYKSIDFACAHLWVQNWGKYNMSVSNDSSLENAKKFAISHIQNVTKWAASVRKPILLEEFGMARDVWHNDVSKGQYQYDCSAPTTHRDSYFAMLYTMIREGFEQNIKGNTSSSNIGIMPWSYGGIFRSATQEYTKYKIIIAGDPPQEPPCWYSILDKDNVMSLLKAENGKIQAMLGL